MLTRFYRVHRTCFRHLGEPVVLHPLARRCRPPPDTPSHRRWALQERGGRGAQGHPGGGHSICQGRFRCGTAGPDGNVDFLNFLSCVYFGKKSDQTEAAEHGGRTSPGRKDRATRGRPAGAPYRDAVTPLRGWQDAGPQPPALACPRTPEPQSPGDGSTAGPPHPAAALAVTRRVPSGTLPSAALSSPPQGPGARRRIPTLSLPLPCSGPWPWGVVTPTLCSKPSLPARAGGALLRLPN